MRSPELEKILEDHSLWWKTGGKKGARLDLSGADLSGADLTKTLLHYADLTRVGMYGAIFVKALAPRANFSGAYMADTNMRDVDLSDADLTGANLTGARLPRGNDIQGVSHHVF
jgi:uncharacterized protein YjbI with pentapeptide repeats